MPRRDPRSVKRVVARREGKVEKGPDGSPGKATGFPAAEVSVDAPHALHARRSKKSDGPALSQTGERARWANYAQRVSRDYWPK